MKKLMIGAITLLVVLLVSVSCARAPAPMPAPAPYPAPATQAPGTKLIPPAPSIVVPAPTPAPAPRPTAVPAPLPPGASGSSQASDADRMIVRTGQMSLLVNDIPGTIDRVIRLTENYKGYVVSSSSWKEGERLRGTIAIRVPAADFGNVMKALSELAVEVTSQSTSSKDVTEEYTDLAAKLKNLEAAEQQLLRIMEKATKVEDILAVQRELTNTRSQIEQIKGRMQYLERTSATSLINVNLEQANLNVKFTADKTSVKAGETVRFTGQIAGGSTPYSYEWDFGDRNTSTTVVPTHDYKSTGSYTVTLKVTDDRGNTATEARKDYITVIPGWSAGNVVSSAWSGLGAFGRGLADVLIWAGIFSPVWVVLGGVSYWWWHRRRKKA